MKALLGVALLLIIAAAQSPPVWPVRFQQDFVESYTTSHIHTVGKLWYDTERNMQRLDRGDGKNVAFCSSIRSQATPCIQLIRESKRYVIFPLLRQCCLCCDSAHGCGVLKRDWLKTAKFAGKQDISGQTFNKFVDTDAQVQYWSTTDSLQIPRRLIEGGQLIKDWIMNTYSQQAIADAIFALPSYCSATNWCPSTSHCGKFQ